MYKKILVPLDGSDRAERILPHVENFALRFGSQIRLIQVIEPILEVNSQDMFVPQGNSYKSAKRRAQTYIDSIASRMNERGLLTEGWVLHGDVVSMICQAAQQDSADLIAIASHGRSGAARVFYGSIASGVMNRVDRPLLLIRSRAD